MMLAPVSFIPNYGVVLSPDAPVLYAQLTSNQQQFAQKPRNKKPVATTETHRAGDWVCILCHNLNYSFRKVCNRCQVQTKRDNLIQSLSMLGKSTSQDEPYSEKEHHITPPGLSKMKEKPKAEYNPESTANEQTNKKLQVKMNEKAANQSSKLDNTPKLTPKKDIADESTAAKESPQDQWTYPQRKKDIGEHFLKVEKATFNHPKAFQLFEGSRLSPKEPHYLPHQNQPYDKSLQRADSEEDENDQDIWRSIDYVLDDCRE